MSPLRHHGQGRGAGKGGREGGGRGQRARTLNEVLAGEHVRIRGHRAQGAVRQRLLDLGLHPRANVVMVRSAPLGDPLELKLESSLIALRRAEAVLIDID
ncbi:FeoA family protein [Thiorhodovibrio winogradskyi]|nr:FeoA domain-containing protein [Thiorhodovibrio winogradskyi]